MLYLTEENLPGYLKEKTRLLEGVKKLEVRSLYGDMQSTGDGFVNFVFQVQTDAGSFVVKQARPYLRRLGETHTLPVERNRIEYETMRIKGAVTPEYVPEILFADDGNAVFISEDLCDLKILRYQMGRRVRYEGLPRLIADYLARNHFYSSYLYLDADAFRSLKAHFHNHVMRGIMERLIFVPEQLGLPGRTPPPGLQELAETFWEDPQVAPACYRLKHLFMQKNECLIHGDFHTSNIFVAPGVMKTIDMEYTFVGPFSYDMGYLINNFIAQYAANVMKSLREGKQALEYAAYTLTFVEELYTHYHEIFTACWEKDVKKEYRAIPDFKDGLLQAFFHESLGFAACSNISRITAFQDYPDFDIPGDPLLTNAAKRLSLAVSKCLLFKWSRYACFDEAVEDIREITALSLKHLTLF